MQQLLHNTRLKLRLKPNQMSIVKSNYSVQVKYPILSLLLHNYNTLMLNFQVHWSYSERIYQRIYLKYVFLLNKNRSHSSRNYSKPESNHSRSPQQNYDLRHQFIMPELMQSPAQLKPQPWINSSLLGYTEELTQENLDHKIIKTLVNSKSLDTNLSTVREIGYSRHF